MEHKHSPLHLAKLYRYLPIIIIGVVILFVGGWVYFHEMNFLTTLPKVSDRQEPQAQTSKIISGSLDKTKEKTDEEWKKILAPDQYTIVRLAGTEIPFTGALLHEKRKGTYYSVGCKEPVFRSETKYDSGTGWPSFWDPISKDALVLREDTEIPGQSRIEVLDKCGGHLGHVFDDGPNPTGKRYCMNSAALYFVPDKNQ